MAWIRTRRRWHSRQARQLSAHSARRHRHQPPAAPPPLAPPAAAAASLRAVPSAAAASTRLTIMNSGKGFGHARHAKNMCGPCYAQDKGTHHDRDMSRRRSGLSSATSCKPGGCAWLAPTCSRRRRRRSCARCTRRRRPRARPPRSRPPTARPARRAWCRMSSRWTAARRPARRLRCRWTRRRAAARRPPGHATAQQVLCT